jgi:membrane protease subunit HflK
LRSSFAVVKVLMVVLVVLFFASGFFTVQPQQRAIILRLGRPVGTGENALLGPGTLHWSYPYPIDEVRRVSVLGIQKVSSTVGWYAVTPEQELAGMEPPPASFLNPMTDGYVLTADNNIIHTRATVTYHVSDPVRYIFNFVDASNAVQNALDNALLYAAAHFAVDDVLTRDVAGFQEAVRARVTELVQGRNLGVAVEQCTVQSIAPRQLTDAFANVLKAEVMRAKVLDEARSFENQITNKADADAGSLLNAAESDRIRLVKEISSRAGQFQDLLPKYRANPGLFVQQRLTETLGRVFTNAQDKILVPENANGNPRELRYNLNREPIRTKLEEAKP